MDERMVLEARERPPDAGRDGSGAVPAVGEGAPRDARPISDPRALTILSTEHWSLLSARGLVYNEAFSRAGMFLTFLSTTLIALSLFSTATGFSTTFLVIVAVVLGIDLFIGLSSMGRIASASGEDIRMLQGMNRIRHAYHEMVPGLEDYFVSSKYDDMRGVFAIYGAPEMTRTSTIRAVLHGFTTVPGAIGVICATLGAVEAGVVAALLGAPDMLCVAIAVAALFAGVALSLVTMQKLIGSFTERADVRFPTPVERNSPE